ncbi:MAG: hypothetical protein U0L18_11295 [Acutalibacteraceae bacterium]|nr:hypothetical protein [Acutalibacteraceae bacterium]
MGENTKEYTQEKFLEIMKIYNSIDRKIIKANLVKVYKKYNFKNQNVRIELNMAKSKVDSWTTMSMPNIPTFYDAMRMAVHFGFNIEELIVN